MGEDTALANRVARHLALVRAEPTKPVKESRLPLPVYHHRRPRCPECGGAEFDSNKMRSRRQPDGKSRQVKTCSHCRFQFVLILE